jgi:hypothetical protein
MVLRFPLLNFVVETDIYEMFCYEYVMGFNSTVETAEVLCRFGGESGTHVLSTCNPAGSNFYEG